MDLEVYILEEILLPLVFLDAKLREDFICRGGLLHLQHTQSLSTQDKRGEMK